MVIFFACAPVYCSLAATPGNEALLIYYSNVFYSPNPEVKVTIFLNLTFICDILSLHL
jgi:hypothetical protein